MKYIKEYLNDIIKVKPLGKLSTKDDELNGMSGEMVYIDGKCSDIFISHADYANWLEKQGEQNPIDNVEPKFHEGEWITCKELNTAKIISIDGVDADRYEVECIDGTKGFPHVDYVDRNFHLWTTEDAQDGDVLLSSDGSIFIFKEVVDFGCKHYIALATDGTIQVNDNFTHFWESVNGVCPTTKEQRDTLEKALAEAGYTFDFDKKELKELEQKPAWSREDEQNLNAVLGYIDDEYLRRWLKDAIYNKYENPYEWSEEDEHKIKDIVYFLDTAKKHYASTVELDACIEWIKSLKNRVQLRQEWSEEEGKRLQRIIDFLWHNRKGDTDTIYQQEQDINWLKTLRLLNTRKPSDGQVKAFEHFVRSIGESGYASPYENITKLLYSLLNDLKKLQEE